MKELGLVLGGGANIFVCRPTSELGTNEYSSLQLYSITLHFWIVNLKDNMHPSFPFGPLMPLK